MAAKLKVFVTSDGLTDYVVAASSRPKALDAWGVRQDLFKSGDAHEVTDPALVAEAQASPGQMLQRPAAASGALKALKATPAKRPKGPTAADRKRVAELEARLEALSAEHDARQAAIAAERAALDARADRETAAYQEEREALQGRLDQARRRLKP